MRLYPLAFLLAALLAWPAPLFGQTKDQPSATAKKQAAAPTPAPSDAPAVKPNPPDTDTPGAGLTLESIATQRKAAEENAALPDDVKKQTLTFLDQAAAALRAEAESLAATKIAEARISTGPEETRQVQAEIEKLSGVTPVFKPEVNENTTSKELNLQLTQAKAALQQQQTEATRAEEALEDRLQLATQYATKIADADKRIVAIDGESPVAGEDAALADARGVSRAARRRAAIAQKQQWQKEQLSHDIRVNRLKAIRDLAKLSVKPLDAKVKAYQDAYEKLRAAENKMALERSRRAVREAMAKDPAFGEVAKQNQQHAARNQELDELIKGKRKNADRVAEQLKQLREEVTGIQQAIERGLSQSMARELVKRRQEVSASQRSHRKDAADREAAMADLQAEKLSIDGQRRSLENLDEAVDKLVAKATSEGADTTEMAGFARGLLEEQKNLLSQQDNLLLTAQSETQRHHTAAGDYHDEALRLVALVDEHLLWVADAEPFSTKTLKDLAAATGWLLNPVNWTEAITAVGEDVKENPGAWVMLALPFFFLLGIKRRMRRAADARTALVKKVDTDRFSHTVMVGLIEMVTVAAWPYLMAATGFWLQRSPTLLAAEAGGDFARALGAGVLRAAGVLYLLRLAMRLFRRGGVADLHFRWRDESIAILRRNIAWVAAATVPMVVILEALNWLENIDHINSLGRVLFVTVMLITSVYAYRILHPEKGAVADFMRRNTESWTTRLRWVWVAMGVLMPIAAAVAALIGYFYAAQVLGGERFGGTAWLLMGLVLLQGLTLRWFFVEHRKLSVAIAREKREKVQKEQEGGAEKEHIPAGEDGGAPVPVQEPPDVDLAQINDQTRQLLRTVFAVAGVAGLYAVWSDVLPALSILERVSLWGEGTEVISLLDLAKSLLLVFVTIVAAKNLPGLLEITILQRLPADAGVRYATSTICRYLIVGFGVFAAFNAIGLGWARIQWLIAAMGVGLGFGLQEIFANFVSGVILLFERPIRVGDIVTVGDVTGVVNRIRIRATTIVNWDRKEYIVPNKEFVTGRLLNWTLSDKINRIVINVGVAYGSDTEKAREVLLRVCNDHPLILDDPKTIVTFEGFGDSTLNFVVRTYLPNMDNRIEVIHQLHTSIDQAFRKEGLEIAFPQRDLHIRSVDPAAVNVINKSEPGEA